MQLLGCFEQWIMAMLHLLVTEMRVAGFVCFDARYGDEWEDGDWDEWDGWDEGWWFGGWVRYGSDAFCKLANYMVAMACKATCSNLYPTFSGRRVLPRQSWQQKCSLVVNVRLVLQRRMSCHGHRYKCTLPTFTTRELPEWFAGAWVGVNFTTQTSPNCPTTINYTRVHQNSPSNCLSEMTRPLASLFGEHKRSRLDGLVGIWRRFISCGHFELRQISIKWSHPWFVGQVSFLSDLQLRHAEFESSWSSAVQEKGGAVHAVNTAGIYRTYSLFRWW